MEVKMAHVEWATPNPACRQAGDNENDHALIK